MGEDKCDRVDKVAEFRELQRATHYRQQDETNRCVRNACTTKTFWVGMVLMFFLTSVFHWNLGYPVASLLGVVPKGTLSGSAEHEELEHARGVIANQKQRQQRMIEANKTLRERSHNAELKVARLETEVEQLKKIEHESAVKREQNAETMLAYKGVLFDEYLFFEQAKKANRFRQTEPERYGESESHELTFNKWFLPLQNRILKICVEQEKMNALRWIVGEPNWDKHINAELKADVMGAIDVDDLINANEVITREQFRYLNAIEEMTPEQQYNLRNAFAMVKGQLSDQLK